MQLPYKVSALSVTQILYVQNIYPFLVYGSSFSMFYCAFFNACWQKYVF